MDVLCRSGVDGKNLVGASLVKGGVGPKGRGAQFMVGALAGCRSGVADRSPTNNSKMRTILGGLIEL